MNGPAPKPPSRRRRSNTPASYGLATPTTGGTAAVAPSDLGFPAHKLIQNLWNSLKTSVESKFYSEADWDRVRLELFHGNKLLKRAQISANAWSAFQAGLNDLLISPADKRRAGIEILAAVDPDAEAAVAQMAAYR